MLPETGFLKAASPDLLEMMNSISVAIDLPANAVLFSEYDEGDALYVVGEGSVEISVIWDDGRKLGLEIMRKGAVFGEIALFDPGPRTATATTMEPCKLYQVRNEDLLRTIQKSPELSLELLRLAGERMRWMNMQLHEYVFLALPARLARKLLHLTAETGNADGTFRLSQTELADFTGATREAVSKTLSVWKLHGMVETGRGKLTVLDREALRQVAGFEDV
ncbi:Transcriptional regulator, Crp/Fnr family [Sulfitobacter noctilucicola]|uniref:CRP-like cAMP-binding protein n=1 Tax=Sulfitobacter noctilucicola TaxID=1342301 RepID=A0A7W6M8J3_9RHOB|nr:Crp/Fnr family transcriptional regulator [Sulfitobacter noctilucicola]KIN62075.1 Transcriptional regulator, Crp/Fnr family [Sulfitobacter noctilucicola]MBB4173406.1 CRP-like cAMP-binding protein [Sulfitobacter noctilucicola]